MPTSADANGNVTVEYKPFGVSLSFTPVVLSEGRISLHIQTEVSELTGTGALTVGGATLPGLNVRRAETTLELPSGGALVMSGLLQDTEHQVISGLPGIRNVPILGALFGSRDFQHNETELVIIVTPYIVNPVAPSATGSARRWSHHGRRPSRQLPRPAQPPLRRRRATAPATARPATTAIPASSSSDGCEQT